MKEKNRTLQAGRAVLAMLLGTFISTLNAELIVVDTQLVSQDIIKNGPTHDDVFPPNEEIVHQPCTIDAWSTGNKVIMVLFEPDGTKPLLERSLLGANDWTPARLVDEGDGLWTHQESLEGRPSNTVFEYRLLCDIEAEPPTECVIKTLTVDPSDLTGIWPYSEITTQPKPGEFVLWWEYASDGISKKVFISTACDGVEGSNPAYRVERSKVGRNQWEVVSSLPNSREGWCSHVHGPHDTPMEYRIVCTDLDQAPVVTDPIHYCVDMTQYGTFASNGSFHPTADPEPTLTRDPIGNEFASQWHGHDLCIFTTAGSGLTLVLVRPGGNYDIVHGRSYDANPKWDIYEVSAVDVGIWDFADHRLCFQLTSIQPSLEIVQKDGSVELKVVGLVNANELFVEPQHPISEFSVALEASPDLRSWDATNLIKNSFRIRVRKGNGENRAPNESEKEEGYDWVVYGTYDDGTCSYFFRTRGVYHHGVELFH